MSYAKKSRFKKDNREPRLIGSDLADAMVHSKVRKIRELADHPKFFESQSWLDIGRKRSWSAEQVAEAKAGFERRYNQLRG